jgi:lambda family phage portal protein
VNVLAKWARKLLPRQRVVVPVNRRSFDGGAHDRLVASWTSSNQSANSEIYNNLQTMRARSRDLYNNNEYAKHFMNMIVTNVVGSDGIGYQSMARQRNGSLDTRDNDMFEARMSAWSKVGQCDVTRRLSRVMLERQFVLGLVRDGEAIIRKFPGFSNEFGFALQAVDPDLLDIDYNVPAGRAQNQIIMGVEIDRFGASIAFHFLDKHPDPFSMPAAMDRRQRTRVPADQVIHAFLPLRPGQVRGVPWVHAGMRALRDLGGYREAAVIASRVGASKMGFWTSPDGLGAPYDGKDNVGNLVDDVEPGRFQQLPEGVSLASWDPTYPHDQFDSFNKAMLRGLAGALGVSYFTLNNDLEGVNLSSARIGLQGERDVYRFVQNFVVETLNENWYPEWLSMQLMLMPNMPSSRFDKFNAAAWIPRTWGSPDPVKDAQTAGILIGLNLTSPQRVIRERGHDPDEVLREIEQWHERLEELGLPATHTTGIQVEVEPDESTQASENPVSEDSDARAGLH